MSLIKLAITTVVFGLDPSRLDYKRVVDDLFAFQFNPIRIPDIALGTDPIVRALLAPNGIGGQDLLDLLRALKPGEITEANFIIILSHVAQIRGCELAKMLTTLFKFGFLNHGIVAEFIDKTESPLIMCHLGRILESLSKSNFLTSGFVMKLVHKARQPLPADDLAEMMIALSGFGFLTPDLAAEFIGKTEPPLELCDSTEILNALSKSKILTLEFVRELIDKAKKPLRMYSLAEIVKILSRSEFLTPDLVVKLVGMTDQFDRRRLDILREAIPQHCRTPGVRDALLSKCDRDPGPAFHQAFGVTDDISFKDKILSAKASAREDSADIRRPATPKHDPSVGGEPK